MKQSNIRFYATFVFCIILGCTNKSSHCIIKIDELLKLQKSKVVVVNPKTTLVNDIVDRGTDSSTEVGYYTFYNNGAIKSYKFFATKQAYVYNEEYDQQGNVVNIQGTPLVYRKGKNIGIDSIIFKYFFSTINRTYDPLIIVSIGKDSFEVKLLEDSLHSYMKYAAFGLSTKGYREMNIIVNYTYKNICTGEAKTAKDTFGLVRNP